MDMRQLRYFVQIVESGSLANGAGDYFFAGETAVGSKRRALLRFDVASAIPAGSTIVSAALVLSLSVACSKAPPPPPPPLPPADMKPPRSLCSLPPRGGASAPSGGRAALTWL